MFFAKSHIFSLYDYILCFWCKDVGVANVDVVDVGVDGVYVGVNGGVVGYEDDGVVGYEDDGEVGRVVVIDEDGNG